MRLRRLAALSRRLTCRSNMVFVRPHRVLILAPKDWYDPEFFREQFSRLGSIHKRVILIYPDDTCRWQIDVHGWCAAHPDQFYDRGFQKNVFKVGSGEDIERDWKMFFDGNPDEVWRVESSKGCKGRPNAPIFPHLWNAALGSNMTCISYKTPYNKKKPRNPGYMTPAVHIRKKKI